MPDIITTCSIIQGEQVVMLAIVTQAPVSKKEFVDRLALAIEEVMAGTVEPVWNCEIVPLDPQDTFDIVTGILIVGGDDDDLPL